MTGSNYVTHTQSSGWWTDRLTANTHLKRCVAPDVLLVWLEEFNEPAEPDTALRRYQLLLADVVVGECGKSGAGQQTDDLVSRIEQLQQTCVGKL